jgi:hypothetical protein
MTLMRQRSPSTMSFHADPHSGLDDLDVTIIKHVQMTPGISIQVLASRLRFFDNENPAEEIRASYAQIWYRVETLTKEGIISTRREPSNKGMERRCYPP